jgi:hypothetical protein
MDRPTARREISSQKSNILLHRRAIGAELRPGAAELEKVHAVGDIQPVVIAAAVNIAAVEECITGRNRT